MPSWAHAIEYYIGAGLSLVSINNDGAQPTAAIDASVAYRMTPAFGLGVHLRGSRLTGTADRLMGDFSSTDYELDTLDVAIAAQLTRGRVLFEPWLGAHFARGHMNTSSLGSARSEEPLQPSPMITGGVLLGVDVWSRDPHRISLYLNVQITYEAVGPAGVQPFTEKFSGPTLGVAYRRL